MHFFQDFTPKMKDSCESFNWRNYGFLKLNGS
jgi:hypothetical protein